MFLVETGEYAKGTQKFTAYTGYAEVPTLKAASGKELGYHYAIAKGAAAFVYIDASGDAAEAAMAPVYPLLYVTNSVGTVTGTGVTATYTLTGVVDGVANTELTTLNSDTSPLKNVVRGKFYDVVKTAEGDITGLTERTDVTTCTTNADLPANGVLGTWAFDGTEKVFIIDAKTGAVSEGVITALLINDQYIVQRASAVSTSPDYNKIGTIYIVKL